MGQVHASRPRFPRGEACSGDTTLTERTSPGSGTSHFRPGVDFLLGLILCVTIALLQLTFELLALTVDRRQIVVGQLSPLLLDFAGKLLPIAFSRIPVHVRSPYLYGCA